MRLQEERIVAMVEIVVEIIQRFDTLANTMSNVDMMMQNILERIDRQFQAQSDIEILAEAESAEVVWVDDRGKVLVVLDQSHDGRGSKDDVEVGISVVALRQLARPVGVLERLVDEEGVATRLYKLACKFDQRVLGEVKVVEIDIERSLAEFGVGSAQFLGIVEQEVGLADASSALDSNQSVAPIDFVHQDAPSGHLHMLDEIIVCFIKCL